MQFLARTAVESIRALASSIAGLITFDPTFGLLLALSLIALAVAIESNITQRR